VIESISFVALKRPNAAAFRFADLPGKIAREARNSPRQAANNSLASPDAKLQPLPAQVTEPPYRTRMIRWGEGSAARLPLIPLKSTPPLF
jgi:hypothetical protein